MKISILTLFPEFFDGFLTNSIIKRALAKQLVDIEIINIRDFTNDKYGRVDSTPVGGGAGLIIKCQPVLDCLKSVRKENSHVVLLSPRGKTYNQAHARYFASKIEHLVIICGHYEGIDERINKHVDELVSIGDYILTGGEIGAEIISDSIIRLLDGVIAPESIVDESFENAKYDEDIAESQNAGSGKTQWLLYKTSSMSSYTSLSDYNKIIGAFEKSSRNPDIYAEYYRMTTNPGVIFIKVKHKKAPHLFVDIFPSDIYERTLNEEEQILKTEEIKQLQKSIQTKALNLNDNELLKLINEKINEAGNLLLEAFTVMLNIFIGKHTAHISAAGRVTHRTCTAAYQADRTVAGTLHVCHSHQSDKMTSMEAVRRGVKADIESNAFLIK